MKKIIMLSILVASFSAKADLFDLFDFTKFGQALLMFADGVNDNLEKVRLASQQQVDIRQQWDLACETTQSLNQNVVALSSMLSKYKVNQQVCAPITTVLNLQADIVKNCQNYYSKPVPDNAEHLLNQFTITLLQSKMILTKCFPILSNIKLPGLP